MSTPGHNFNIRELDPLPTPAQIHSQFPASQKQLQWIQTSRNAISSILNRIDDRLLIILGPCSIHDTQAALEYAHNLKDLATELQDRALLVMRAYFEKPRTTLGWEGLIMDPHLDGSYDVPEGLRRARHFLLQLADLQIPVATEFLDSLTPQYTADLISWCAIGARTVESQTHRQIASGLSMPVGFKNSTDGNIDKAVNAIIAANKKQTFLGINHHGQAAYVKTTGNPNCHIVLRGSDFIPNFYKDDVKHTIDTLQNRGLKSTLIIDCSHGNSGKDPKRQADAFTEVSQQITEGNASIRGIMLESNLFRGNQPFPTKKEDLQYGVSITDRCLGWEETARLIRTLTPSPSLTS